MALALDDLWPPATHARSRAVAVHNRFRDLDERWKSASAGRRNRLPPLLRQTIDPAKWGRRVCPPVPLAQTNVGGLVVQNSQKRYSTRPPNPPTPYLGAGWCFLR